VADTKEQTAPQLTVEDAKPETKEAAKPVSTETREVNGIEMTFEDY